MLDHDPTDRSRSPVHRLDPHGPDGAETVPVVILDFGGYGFLVNGARYARTLSLLGAEGICEGFHWRAYDLSASELIEICREIGIPLPEESTQ